jgi:hypothetical protein
MFPDSPFATPRGSFERPVPLVLVDPCDDPSITVKIHRAWVPYVLGALQQLVLQATWDTTDPDALWLVQQRAMKLLSCVVQAFDEPQCDPGCVTYPMDAPIFTWEPTNPFSDPEFVPPGYRFPAWFIAGDSVVIPGIKPGDMVTDLLHGPIVEPLSAGFPRFRITCAGTGTVEVEFVRFPTAGVALVTVDGDLGSAKWIDLHISLSASVGSAESEMIIPIEITKPGNHVIDISMLYSITEDPPFVHFGGGIRNIELCGFGVSPDPFPATYIIGESDYEMTICEQLKFEDGILKGLCCGDWTPISGQSGGVISSGSTQPTNQPRPAPGQSKCFNVLLNANNQWQLPINVQDGDTVTISEIQGAWTDGALNWYCPDGFPYILNQCVPSSRGHAGGDPDTTDFHMQLIAKVGSAFFPGTDGAFTIPGGTGVQTLVLQANDGTLGDNGGSISFKICVENGATPPAGEWCYIMDFRLADYGFAEIFNGSEYVLGTGWQSRNPGPDFNGYTQICLTLPGTVHVTYAEVRFTNSGDFTATLPPSAVGIGDVCSSPTWWAQVAPATGAQVLTVTPDEDATEIRLDAQLGKSGSVDPNCIITYLILHGTGVNPFGSDNC